MAVKKRGKGGEADPARRFGDSISREKYNIKDEDGSRK